MHSWIFRNREKLEKIYSKDPEARELPLVTSREQAKALQGKRLPPVPGRDGEGANGKPKSGDAKS